MTDDTFTGQVYEVLALWNQLTEENKVNLKMLAVALKNQDYDRANALRAEVGLPPYERWVSE